ncbi:hypothetical protein EPN44_06705 [bacterium]|nr:MAG: hypothetical protein EPN44_06705 [bacterium]
MVAVMPVAIVVSSSVVTALLLYAAWDAWGERAFSRTKDLKDLLSRAGVTGRPEEIFLTALGIAALLWIALIFAVRPPLFVSVLLLAAFLAGAVAGVYSWANVRCKRRLKAFVQQLEMALRLISSSLRVGLGLRQALAISVEELPEPSRHEFTRVVGQTNIGVSAYDALDDLAKRMPSNEMLMMARAIRIQSQTGGDLARVLEHLANTIRERRRLDRKRQAITAEGRMSAIVLCAIPVVLTLFIMATQVDMAHALVFTMTGHITLTIIVVLELLGIATIRLMLRNVA